MADKRKTVNGVRSQEAAQAAQAAQADITRLQQQDRERFFDAAADCQDIVDRAVAVYGENSPEVASAKRVAATTLKIVCGGYDGDEFGAKLAQNAPGAMSVHTHSNSPPSLRQIITRNRQRAEAEKQSRLNQGKEGFSEPHVEA